MFKHMPLVEKAVVFLLIVLIAFFGSRVFFEFRSLNAVMVPGDGGVYTEGLMGQLTTMNPLLARSSVDRDVTRLLFSGLTKYNASTGKIEPDLAEYTVSGDRKVYTFTLKKDLFWHDGEPLTVDDVMYTYKVVLQNQSFPNKFLQDAFKDIDIQRISDHEVSFKLSKPYSFFLSNVTLGILPKHILNLVPIESLSSHDFNLHPIGSGPFMFSSYDPGMRESRIVLKRFDKYYGGAAHIDSVVFRVFPAEHDLSVSINSLTGVKSLPSGTDMNKYDRFEKIEYTLPQYVAVFLNTQSPLLSLSKTRFAFLLATDKDDLIRRLGGGKAVVDTPILEAKEGLDIEYNELRAKGAFFDTAWKLRTVEVTSSSTEVANSDLAPSAGAGSALENQSNVSDATVSVRVVADSDVRMKIVVDGKERSDETLGAGATLNLSFTTTLIFKYLENAGGIKLYINDREAKPLGLSGETVENLTINSNELDVLYKDNSVPDAVSSQVTQTEKSPAEMRQELALPDEDKKVYKLNVDPTLIRSDESGKALQLKLITSTSPSEYLDAALVLQEQWLKAGVDLIVEAYEPEVLQQKIRERAYDVLLFGQNLGYNLDAFPFWHSSQAESGLNLSQYKSLETDSLLTDIRTLPDGPQKLKQLDKLKSQVAAETPAIFLYTPVYTYMVDKKVRGVDISHLALESDRFNSLQNWFMGEKPVLRPGVTWKDFYDYVIAQLGIVR
jgi:ABC-type transport system substrate-binding protein